MDWPLRLKIAIGVAKGFTWLHHNCNPCISNRNTTTLKGDVYSFVIVLLELVTSERSTNLAKAPKRINKRFVDWIFRLSRAYVLLDSNFRSFVGKGYDGELSGFLNIACSCVLTDPTIFEACMFFRAIEQQYNMATKDDILLPFVDDLADQLDELIIT
ncbi:probably inactive leucine-rich repeat receptor-like protein kinase At5g48380 [Olea europaea var. sylvestris]|uniref:probably inactive leucine-rich repeat receptor-like protein kinase At5g48380 n=1 Tax=Olea europaea var. sylvestris TaxID=158386 RepID=UPI000C1D4998|nr:probably inactive leucine-rich repeat receptor-like protein kinase At5g48380 [Olea europaea var. sylvestris]